jgi:hypothetical protein
LLYGQPQSKPKGDNRYWTRPIPGSIFMTITLLSLEQPGIIVFQHDKSVVVERTIVVATQICNST